MKILTDIAEKNYAFYFIHIPQLKFAGMVRFPSTTFLKQMEWKFPLFIEVNKKLA